METITINVEGISPLLINSPGGMIAAANRGPVKTKKSLPTPEEEAELGTYRNIFGDLCFPTAAFRGALIGGAQGRKVGMMGLGTILKGAVFPADEMTDLLDPDTGKALQDYELDVRRAVVQKKAAIMRARAKLTRWGAAVRFEIDTDFTDFEMVAEMLAIGGTRTGIGNYRPEKSGPYGRFRVVGQ